MIDPKLLCPHCKCEIHLTESLAAPLLASAREQFNKQLLAKDADIAKREAGMAEQAKAIAQA